MEDCSRERFFGDCCPDWKVLKKTPNVFFPSKFWVLLQRNSTTAFDPSSQLGLTRPINLEVFHFPFSDLRKIWTKGKKSNLIKILTPHPTPWVQWPARFFSAFPAKTVLLHKSAKLHFWAPGTAHKAHTSNKLSNCEEKTWNKGLNKTKLTMRFLKGKIG